MLIANSSGIVDNDDDLVDNISDPVFYSLVVAVVLVVLIHSSPAWKMLHLILDDQVMGCFLDLLLRKYNKTPLMDHHLLTSTFQSRKI